ncbi:MAG TPA: glycosidase [Candidatus Kryptonia bacterium]
MNDRVLPEVLNVERLHDSKPILSAVREHPWESEVVFNPACFLLNEKSDISRLLENLSLPKHLLENLKNSKAICVLIYRAQGITTEAEDFRRSRLGLALLTPELELLYRHLAPIVTPENDYEDLGVEDPRIIRIKNRFFMLYTGYSSKATGEHGSTHANKINICLAVSDDLVSWKKFGVLKGKLNEIDNKNAVFFSKKVGSKYQMLHRPMEGKDPMSIHIAHSARIFGEWTDDGVALRADEAARFSKSWIGAGAPPLQISNNKFLMLYHTGHYKINGAREYDLGLCVFSLDGGFQVLEKVEPLMIPETSAETEGNVSLGVNNVLFVCGSYFYGGYLYFPYAGADSVILGARIKMDI